MIATLLSLVVASNPITLGEVRAAARENIQVLRAAVDVQLAQLGFVDARALALPKVQLNASGQVSWASPVKDLQFVPDSTSNPPRIVQVSSERPSITTPSFGLQLTLQQVLFDGGRWFFAIARAGALEQAQAAQLEEQKLASEFEAVRRFYALVDAQNTTKLLNETASYSKQIVTRTEALFQAGRSQKRDVIDSQANLAQDQINAVRQKDSTVQAQSDLLKWIGRPYRDVEAVDDAKAPEQKDNVQNANDWVQKARDTRPYLKAVAKQRDAQNFAIKVSNAAHFPQLNLNGGYARRSTAPQAFFTDWGRQNSLFAGLNISLDIFSGLSTEAQVKRDRLQLENANSTLRQAQAEMESDIERGQSAIARANDVAVLAKEALARAQESLSLATQRLEAGVGSALEVRDAQLRLLRAQLDSARARTDYQVAWAQIEWLTGQRKENLLETRKVNSQ